MQFKKFKSLASTYIKKSILLLVISSISVFMLCSCGKNNSTSIETDVIEEDSASSETDATVEPTDVSENTTEPTETPDNRSEENPESGEVDLTGNDEITIDLDENEYYVDYPMISDDTVVCVKINDQINFNTDTKFYPDKDTTAADYYNETGIIRCSLTDKYFFEAKIDYILNPVLDVDNYYNSLGSVTTITDYDNTIYSVIDSNYTKYIIVEYEIDDNNKFQILIEDANNRLSVDDENMLIEYFGNNTPFEVVR